MVATFFLIVAVFVLVVSVSDAVTADFTAVEECEDDDDNDKVEHGGGVVVGSVVVPAKRTIFSSGVEAVDGRIKTDGAGSGPAVMTAESMFKVLLVDFFLVVAFFLVVDVFFLVVAFFWIINVVRGAVVGRNNGNAVVAAVVVAISIAFVTRRVFSLVLWLFDNSLSSVVAAGVEDAAPVVPAAAVWAIATAAW